MFVAQTVQYRSKTRKMNSSEEGNRQDGVTLEAEQEHTGSYLFGQLLNLSFKLLVTQFRLECRGFELLHRARDFSLLRNTQTVSGDPPSSHLIGTGAHSRGTAAGASGWQPTSMWCRVMNE